MVESQINVTLDVCIGPITRFFDVGNSLIWVILKKAVIGYYKRSYKNE